MFVNLRAISNRNLKVAVAVSGGGDSMALLHYLCAQQKKLNFKVIALNVEHGIRDEQSLKDTEFVKIYCKQNKIPLLTYSVNSIDYAKENKLSLEQSARILRYECFYTALNSQKCQVIATAHHSRDNAESVLLNLFRGTGIKGLKGILPNFEDKIIRPFLSVSKQEIEQYLSKHKIPFVTDQTNLCDDYTRNFIRLNILPKIKEIFPEVENSISRLSALVSSEDEFLDSLAEKSLIVQDNLVKIPLTLAPVLFNRGVILALKKLGVKKDWAKVHVDDVSSLTNKENGKFITLPQNVVAVREYDVITLKQNASTPLTEFNAFTFKVGSFNYNGNSFSVEECKDITKVKNLLNNRACNTQNGKKPLFVDGDAIPKTAVIRIRQKGDKFTPFNCGSKTLSDYFTDKKIPLLMRDSYPVLADGKEILAIFGIEISQKLKINSDTKKIIKLT